MNRCGRTETPRQALEAMLVEGEHDALALSQALSLTEKEVIDHLEHLRKSVRSRDRELVIGPARCLGCGFVFEARERLARPGRCPECGRSRITRPTFRIVER